MTMDFLKLLRGELPRLKALIATPENSARYEDELLYTLIQLAAEMTGMAGNCRFCGICRLEERSQWQASRKQP